MKYANRKRGKLAKSRGDIFETEINLSCYINGASPIQIPSGCKWRKTPTGVRAVPEKTPFDFVIALHGKCAFFDAKSTDAVGFGFSLIKPHQVAKLLELERQGFNSGYLIKFTKFDSQIAFFTSSQLIKLKPRESLKLEDGAIHFGTDLKSSLLRIFVKG